jgi:uncharacterized repeat protein (TIGR01451 family)
MTNQLLKVPIGTFLNAMLAIVYLWLVSAIPLAWAGEDYEVKIRFVDIFEQTANNLAVNAGGKTATLVGDYYIINDLPEGEYTLMLTTPGYQSFSREFNIGANHPKHDFKTHYALKSTDGYRIEGTVVDGSGNALSGVTVSTNGTQSLSDANGFFGSNFSDTGSYPLTFEKSGYPTVTESFAISDDKPLANTGKVRLVMGYVQIRLINLFDEAISGLNVSAGGKTANFNTNTGDYEIEGLLTDNYTLKVTTTQYKSFSRKFSLSATKPTQRFGTFYLIAATDGYRIEGHVIDAASQALPAVQISVNDKVLTSDANGEFDLNLSSAGSYELTLAKPGYPTVTKTFSVSDDKPLAKASIRLSMGYVKIRFKDIFNDTVNGLTVTVVSKTATLESNGYYFIEGLSAATYTLTMENSGYQSFSREFTLSAGSPTYSFGSVYAIKSTEGYRIEGRIVDAKDNALTGVTVSVANKQTVSDANGYFSISISTAGSYEVTFEKSGYLSVTKSFSVSDSYPLRSAGTIKIIDGYTVSGTVLDINKQGLVGVVVEVDGQSAITGSDGRYSVGGISSYGGHTLTLSKGGNTISRSITISENQPFYNMYSLYLVDNYVISGIVQNVFGNPQAGVRVEAGGSYAITDAKGQYQIFVSKSGRYSVTIKQTGYKEIKTYAVTIGETSPSGTVGSAYAISTTDGYGIAGTVEFADSSVSFSDVTVELGTLTAMPDDKGRFYIKGLVESGYHTVTIKVADDGYRDMSKNFSITDNSPSVNLGTFRFAPNFSMTVNAASAKVELGSEMNYRVNITNNGYAPAHKLKLRTTPALPDGISLISATMVEPFLPDYNTPVGGGITDNCNITDETKILACQYLGTLDGGKTTQMAVLLGFSAAGGFEGNGPGGLPDVLNLSFEAIGSIAQNDAKDNSEASATAYTTVEHFLSFNISGGSSQVEAGEKFSYTLTIHNSENAFSTATDTQLKITLPEVVEMVSATPSQGNCSDAETMVTCSLDTLAKNGSASIELILKPTLVGMGKVSFDLSSEQAPLIQKSAPTFSVIPPPPPPPPMPVGNADLMLVIDDTGSMGEELGALVAALTKFIPSLNTRGASAPTVGLVTFKDEVTHRVITNNMYSLLNSYIKPLVADYGADCPEASLKALQEALPKLKIGGRIILATDASSHTDVDVNELITALRAKGVRVDVILSGDDCVGVCSVKSVEENSVGAIEVFSRIAAETGGLFATPFEVNAETVSGKTLYQNAALNVMLGTVSPSVTVVMPHAVPQGMTMDLRLTAANTSFNSQSEVSFGDGISVNSQEVLSATTINVNITVAETANVGFHDVSVVTQRGDVAETARGIGVLEIVTPFDEPTLLSITPASLDRNGTAAIKITGINTDFGSDSTLSFDDTGITIESVTAHSQTALTAEVKIAENTTLGLHKATITTGGVVITNACSKDISPAIGALLVLPSLDESPIPRLTAITPARGAQGAIRQIDITAVNTHFVQDVSKLRFGEGIYVLDLTINSATELSALIQIDDEADIGFWDVFVYTDEEFATLLDGYEVTTKGPFSVEGYLLDKTGQPLADVELDTGNQLGFTDESGYFKITGLWEGEYEIALKTPDNYLEPVTVIISDNTAINGVVRVDLEAAASALRADVKQETWVVYQDDTFTYTIITTNAGDITATGIRFTDQLPQGASFVSAETLDGGDCTANEEDNNIVICTLPELAPNRSATVKIVGQVEQVIRSSVFNTVTLTSNEYPPDITKTWISFRPYLSVYIKDNPDPVTPGSVLFYTINIELSHYATTQATDIILVSHLPEGVELKSVNTDYGVCDTSHFPTITCNMIDLDIDSADSISHVTVDISVILRDPGLLLLIHEAIVSANEYPIHSDRERTKVDIGEGFVDMVFLIDETGSMRPEINGVLKAINEVIKELEGKTAPWLALVSFKDDVKIEAATQNLEVFQQALRRLETEGGGTCPEASIEALERAIPHVKPGGVIFLATDASPYADADIEGVIEMLRSNAIRFTPMITGDCSMEGSWNSLP